MSVLFWILAAALVLLALAFVLVPLLRAHVPASGLDAPPADHRRAVADGTQSAGVPADGDAPAAMAEGTDAAKRQALDSALQAGILDQAEYQAKLRALAASATAVARPNTVRPARRSALLLALVLPLASWLLYQQLGAPRALQPGALAGGGGAMQQQLAGADGTGTAPSMEQAVSGLAERMREHPDDLGGWMLLGRAYKNMQRFGAAREALANAYRIAPEDADVMVEYAEALTLASDSRRIEGEAAALLERALSVQPAHPRALWLKGIEAYQAADFATAAATWEALRDSLPADADVHASLGERIAEARAQAGLPVAAAAAPQSPAASSTNPDSAVAPATTDAGDTAAGVSGADPGSDAAGTARLTVIVDASPELKARIGASDVLFVYARAAQGPRMPLAIQRLQASQLPVTVVLDDSTSMMPQLKLSTVPQVIVGARVSQSGQAVAQPGDFEVFSEAVPNDRSAPLRLLIDRVVE